MIVMNTKKCGKCGEEKVFSSYSPDKRGSFGLHSRCRECNKKTCREWRIKHRDKVREKNREWRAANREKEAARHKRYYDANREKEYARKKKWAQANREKNNATRNAYRKKQRATNPRYAFTHDVRIRLNQVLGTGSGSGVRDLGCSVEWVMEYLESQFEDGMTWENRGKVWHLDHCYPLSAVDHTDRAQVMAVCNWRNLQPLSIRKNREKRDKIYPEHQKLFDDLVARFRARIESSEATA